MAKKIHRLRELDFLRGIAIILVLFRHEQLFKFTRNMGWIGVDLFFVLSGFLVSGLLFKEYQKFGNIKPGNFLVRRGFKIYPIYYIFSFIYLIPIFIDGNFKILPFLGDMVFIQNYVSDWGYAIGPSWSLAIEEHFYFSVAIALWFVIDKKRIKLEPKENHSGIGKVEKTLLLIMFSCFVMRIFTNIFFPHNYIKLSSMTHLRIDSLLAGVLISYLFYFRNDYLKKLFSKFRKYGLLVALLLLSFTPFIEPFRSFFVKTIGFTMLYIAFGIILLYILLVENINEKLDKIFGRHIVNLISKIGLYSYSIYIIHSLVIYSLHHVPLDRIYEPLHIDRKYIAFPLVLILSILCGKLMTDYIEKFFLRMRDKYYPNRVA